MADRRQAQRRKADAAATLTVALAMLAFMPEPLGS